MSQREQDYKRVELVWPGKRTQVERVKLPFQVIERVNEVRRSEGGQAQMLGNDLPEWWPEGWRNKLIWGDNKYVLASLLDEFAGKVDLIYIDPPFATGADFSYSVEVGDEFSVTKEHSAIEEKAYRDTWGRGYSSYLSMMSPRLALLRELLSPRGTIYVHLDYHLCHYIKIVLDELFGSDRMLAEIIWKRKDAQSFARGFGVIHDVILAYTKSDKYLFNKVYVPLSDETADSWYVNEEMTDHDAVNRLGELIPKGTVRRFNNADMSAPGDRSGTKAHYEWKGVWPPPGRHWAYTIDVLEDLERQGRLIYSASGRPYEKRYLDESKGTPLQTLWADISQLRGMSKRAADAEWLGYATQKPEGLLSHMMEVSSEIGSLVADFFCGSGTTMVVAEKLGRRWIGCDLGRFAIQTSRKRLLDQRARPFEVLNLGRYERRYWQGMTAGEGIGEYYRFIVELYHGEVIPGFAHLHGIKAGHLIHVGATDAPVTEAELRNALEECKANGFKDLDVLGWEWEMGLNRDRTDVLSREFGIRLRLYNIPREVMDKRAVDAGDVHFFEVSVAELEAHTSGSEAVIELRGFLPAIDDYMRKKVGDASLKWSDWIDYWSVDFEFEGRPSSTSGSHTGREGIARLRCGRTRTGMRGRGSTLWW